MRARTIGAGQPCFVVAEIGINHNGKLSLAKELIEKAAKAGADAVKLQKRDASSIMIASRINQSPVGRLSQTADDVSEGAPEFGGWSYPDIRLELPDEDYYELKEFSDQLGVIFTASPWDYRSTDFLVKLGVEFLKVPGFEIKNPSYLEYVAKTGLPLIVSTGTADIDDVDRAMETICRYNNKICLLQCTSAYPSQFNEIDLRVMDTFRCRYFVPVGYSGHEPGIHVPIAAVAMGACVIEKHVTLNRKMNGPDHAASIDMDEFKTMVRQVREVEQAMGSSQKRHYKSENVLMSALGKSVVSAIDIPANTVLTFEMLTTKGPNTGIPAANLASIVGKRTKVYVPSDSLITQDHIE